MLKSEIFIIAVIMSKNIVDYEEIFVIHINSFIWQTKYIIHPPGININIEPIVRLIWTRQWQKLSIFLWV